ENIIKELAKVKSPIEREYYIKEIADEFNLSTDIIYYDIEQYEKRNKSNFKDKYKQNSNTSNNNNYMYQSNSIVHAYQNAERILITYMLQYPHIINKVQNKLGIDFNIDEHKIILTHLYALYEEYNDINVSKIIDKLSDDNLKRIVT